MLSSELDVVEVSDEAIPTEGMKMTHLPGQISLVELRQQTLDAVRGQESLSDGETAQARAKFMSTLQSLKTGRVRGDSLLAAEDAQEMFDRHQESGSGLTVIFAKLGELEKEVKDLQKQEKLRIDKFNAECTAELVKQADIMTTGSNNRNQLKSDTTTSNLVIKESRADWRSSRDAEDITHKALVDLQSSRVEATMAVAAGVDERNQAIDVMQQALFIVCERFARFKNGAICLKVKSQPDVAEPRRYETNPPEEAEAQDKEDHDKAEPLGLKWFNIWEATKKKDIAKENRPNPEGLPTDDGNSTLLGDSNDPDRPKPKPKKIPSLAQVEADDSDDVGKWKLTATEKQSHVALAKLAEKQMPQKYQLPLVELAEAIGEGAAKKSKSIVEILIDVMVITKQDLAKLKSDHTERLENDYDASWKYKETLNSQRIAQDAIRNKMEENRKFILSFMADGETLRQDMNAALKAKHVTEDACNLENEEYGVEEGYRLEDIENLIKLKSLLRMLYYKKKPLDCKYNSRNRALCSGMDRGWCVFTQEHPKNEQRCSCNVGFYGDACEYTMCPGISKNLYRHDASPGVCSNTKAETRGQCDKHTGTCTCFDGNGILRGKAPGADPAINSPPQVNGGYYHGPKRACDFKNAPPSKNSKIDNECSARGDLYINKANPNSPITYENGYDKRRGICHCKNEFWGSACEYKKCPHSNGNLYPSISSNSCNGRGACSDETGLCACQMPFHCGKSCDNNGMSEEDREEASSEEKQALLEGECTTTCGEGKSCQFEDCPDDCRVSGREACNQQTGSCSCAAGTSGPACEFFDCPGSDPGSNACGSGGQCNRNDGICICKKGYSGAKCDKTERCSGKNLDTPYVNWWTIWDKPGWITCPTGQLLYRLQRSLCDSLSCINTGGCAAGCEGSGPDKHIFQIRHCYHDLRWYDAFDTPGWAKCLDDYFVAGLYRSGESLYELQMAKCCSMKEARWVNCDTANWDAIFNGPGTGKIEKKPNIAFITGLKRGAQHTLKGIDGASYCGFVRGY
jgi:hypothetical protein